MDTMWDPEVYRQFEPERARPFHDLLDRVPAPGPGVVVDLGCGPGAMTEHLSQRWPFARVLGVDSAKEMVDAAAEREERGRLEFVCADLREWEPYGPVDVLVSNAALHWVPDHLDLLPRWVDWLAPGGWLALQVPGTFDAPLHTILRDVASRPAYAPHLEEAGLRDGEGQPGAVPSPLEYAEVLAGAGTVVDAWETTYLHVLDPGGALGEDAVLAWAKGTLLRPVLTALADRPEVCEGFLEEYGDAVREAYPRRPWGTPLPYRRVFAVAGKP